MPSMRVRRWIYAILAIPACLVWLPIAVVGVLLGVGWFGLLAIGSLLRCIYALPTHPLNRFIHSAFILIGIFLMAGLFWVWPGSANDRVMFWIERGSGSLLIGLGAAILFEMHARGPGSQRLSHPA